MPATMKNTKLPHWYSNRPLIRIRAMHTSVPTDRKNTVLRVLMTAIRLLGVRRATWMPSTMTKARSTSIEPTTHNSDVPFIGPSSSLWPAGGDARKP